MPQDWLFSKTLIKNCTNHPNNPIFILIESPSMWWTTKKLASQAQIAQLGTVYALKT